jgi:hypothetical protein
VTLVDLYKAEAQANAIAAALWQERAWRLADQLRDAQGQLLALASAVASEPKQEGQESPEAPEPTPAPPSPFPWPLPPTPNLWPWIITVLVLVAAGAWALR